MSHGKGHWDATLFDLDGTLTRKSTLPPFFLKSSPPKQLVSGSVSAAQLLTRYWSGQASFEELLPEFAKALLKGVEEDRLIEAGEAVIGRMWGKGLNEEVLAALRSDLERGIPVAIVTGGLPYCAKALVRRLGASDQVEIFSTRLEFEGKNAKSMTPVMVGEEKLKAVRWAKEKGGALRAFGNSSGDQEMLQAVERPWWVKGSGEIIPWTPQLCSPSRKTNKQHQHNHGMRKQ